MYVHRIIRASYQATLRINSRKEIISTLQWPTTVPLLQPLLTTLGSFFFSEIIWIYPS